MVIIEEIFPDGMVGLCYTGRERFDDTKYDCKWEESKRFLRKTTTDVLCNIDNPHFFIHRDMVFIPVIDMKDYKRGIHTVKRYKLNYERILGVKDFSLDADVVYKEYGASSKGYLLTNFEYSSELKKPEVSSDYKALSNEICDIMNQILDYKQ